MERVFSYNTEILPKVRMIGKIKYAKPWTHFSRTIDEYVFYLIREGEMYIKEDENHFHLKSGDMLLLEPNKQHCGYAPALCDYYYVHFKTPAIKLTNLSSDEALAELSEKRRKSLTSYNLDEADIIDEFTFFPKTQNLSKLDFKAKFKEMTDLYDKREEQYKRVVSALFHSFLLACAHEYLINNLDIDSSADGKRSRIVAEDILHYLNANYSSKISSVEIEQKFEVNFDYINRVFKSMTGYTIYNYRNVLRINNAKQLISTTNLHFEEIGYLVGIEDRYYFSKIFKKYTNMTPSEYYARQCEQKKVR